MNNIVPVTASYIRGSIESNLAEVKASAEAYCKEYENVVITADTVKDGKDMIAKIRKEKKALDEQRKDIKKAWNAPYTAFESEVKEVLKVYDRTIETIDEQLKEFEERRKEAKHTLCMKLFVATPCPEEIEDWVSFEQVFNEKWLNATYSKSNITKDIESKYQQVMMAYNTIKSISHPFEEEGLEELRKTLDLQSAMTKMARLLEMQKHLEEKKAEEKPQAASGPVPYEKPKELVFEEIGFDEEITPGHRFEMRVVLTDPTSAEITKDFLEHIGAEIEVIEWN